MFPMHCIRSEYFFNLNRSVVVLAKDQYRVSYFSRISFEIFHHNKFTEIVSSHNIYKQGVLIHYHSGF